MLIATLDTLKAMLRSGVSESLTLEYKRSEALGKDSSRRNELCKDVSAFANSAGGTLIYGVDESSNILDCGIDSAEITREWIEQVLQSNIHPRIAGISIAAIKTEVESCRVYYVLEIPQAMTLAPHQASDKKYYKRFNFQSVPMEDYEVRDTLKRCSAPALEINFTFSGGKKEETIEYNRPQFYMEQSYSNEISLFGTIYNQLTTPAEYVLVDVFIHPTILIRSARPCNVQYISTPQGTLKLQISSIKMGIPDHFPIFKEAPESMPCNYLLRIPARVAQGSEVTRYIFGYRIRCPGYSMERWGELSFIGSEARILME